MRTILLLAASVLALCGCSKTPGAKECGGATMGTTWTLRTRAPMPSGLQQRIQLRLDGWEKIFSHWQADSAVSRFNGSASTDWIAVPEELVVLVELARQIGAQTDGALDITAAPLIDLWGFGAAGRRKAPPAEAEIAAARALCGWHHLAARHSPPALRKDIPRLRINVSAVAEGWALNQLAARLEAEGISEFLLEIGGEVLALGEWQAGVQDPGALPGTAAQMLTLKNQCLATSGVYRQWFEHGGKRYSHALDPRTGRPVAHALASVSVVHRDAALADGFATALLVLGPAEGGSLARKLGLNVLWFERAQEPGSESLMPR